MRTFLQGLFFALIAFLVAVGFEVLVAIVVEQSSAGRSLQLTPRAELVLVLLPLCATVAGWIYGRQLDLTRVLGRLQAYLDRFGREQRLLIGFSALWLISCSLFFMIFDPFDRYRWGGNEWLKFSFISLGPVGLGFLALKVSTWANKG